MASFNKAILMGRLVNAPETKQIPSGDYYCSFAIAVDRKRGKDGEAKADFFDITAWGKTADFICNYFTKGSPILIDGSLSVDSWVDKQGQKRYKTFVVAREAYFCGAKGNSETNDAPEKQNAVQSDFGASQAYAFEEVDASDGNLPF